jgi:AraC-like DNA-binding protein
MREAEKLLRNTFLSVKEIGFLSGWTDLSHFVRGFKKQHGVTPSEFRVQTQSSATSRSGRIGE